MNRLASRPWLVMALIFVLGIATGVLLTVGLGPRLKTPPGGTEMKNRWMMHLTHRLNLTADQQAKIGPIITEADSQIQSARHEDMDRISGIMETADDNISKLLEPAQREELKKMERERDRFLGGHTHGMHGMGSDGDGHRGGSPPGPPGAP